MRYSTCMSIVQGTRRNLEIGFKDSCGTVAAPQGIITLVIGKKGHRSIISKRQSINILSGFDKILYYNKLRKKKKFVEPIPLYSESGLTFHLTEKETNHLGIYDFVIELKKLSGDSLELVSGKVKFIKGVL